MRLLVETAGAFQLNDSQTRTLIRATGHTVVVQSPFVEQRCALGQLYVAAQVNDDATQEEWLAFVKECEGDTTLAIESFKSKFPLTAPSSEPAEPETKTKKPAKG
jgi:hypothetical protein